MLGGVLDSAVNSDSGVCPVLHAEVLPLKITMSPYTDVLAGTTQHLQTLCPCSLIITTQLIFLFV